MHSKSCRLLLLFALLVLGLSAASFGQVNVFVSFGPPALPVYVQPPCPAEGYIWTPGYWAYAPNFGDYYWVPGTWVFAPVGYLWTPPWWGWNGSGYLFHTGYWGPHVGFYGGIAYGYGYFGRGYEGGRWQGNRFYYNRTVNNVNVTNVRYVYNTRVVNNYNTVNRVSYNGGNGGVTARPTREEETVGRERHIPPVAAQTQHVQAARNDKQLRASTNQGRPPVAATAQPGALRGPQAVPAKSAGAPYQAPAHTANTSAGYSRNNVPRTTASGGTNNVARPPAATNTMGSPVHTQSSYPQQQHGYGKPQAQSQGTQSGMYQPQPGYGKQQQEPVHAQAHVNAGQSQQMQTHQQQMGQPHVQQQQQQQQQHVNTQGHAERGPAPGGQPPHGAVERH